jgi:hypothetical protein
VLAAVPAEEYRAAMMNYAALIISDGEEAAQVISRFKALGEGKLVLLGQPGPERYSTGFRPAVLGADGVTVGDLLPEGPIYDGFGRLGKSVAAAESERSIMGTLSMLLLRQGADDMTLWKQCEKALAGADKAGNAPAEADALRATMAEIQKQVLATIGVRTSDGLADRKIKPRQLDQWQTALIENLQALQSAKPAK